jgi:hypothetical protein
MSTPKRKGRKWRFIHFHIVVGGLRVRLIAGDMPPLSPVHWWERAG